MFCNICLVQFVTPYCILCTKYYSVYIMRCLITLADAVTPTITTGAQSICIFLQSAIVFVVILSVFFHGE